MHLTDSHAHLYAEQFKRDRPEALRRAQDVGVRTIVMPNIDHSSIDAMLELEAQAPETCFAMMGLHPCSVTRRFEQDLYEVEAWLGRRPFAAVGEAGLDLHWDKTRLAEQQEALKIQLELAKRHQLPIVLHTREAFAETVALVEAAQDGTLRGVFHCFSGTPQEAEQVIKLGFLLGIGGVATFKNGGADEVLPGLDLQHLLLETDCPYLAPVPHRGQRNEPAYLPLVLHRVAELLGKDPAEVAAATTRNAAELFKL
ncbi:TatD family hydrolase [Hymenobacter sp. BT664]|uniref:TatD family hydrolase n=1 Tax=Hymenobacter montanus TaxID=2771359 RepID=A0A927BER1_9BACT|nr:TatD family hydrolase [Hymenobacter montanus]MBD2768628.1 TatD family hydrolase [Hymenobacter montanus]